MNKNINNLSKSYFPVNRKPVRIQNFSSREEIDYFSNCEKMFNNSQIDRQKKCLDIPDYKFKNSQPRFLNLMNKPNLLGKSNLTQRVYIPQKTYSLDHQDQLTDHIDEQLYYRNLAETKPFKNKNNYQNNLQEDSTDRNELALKDQRRKPNEIYFNQKINKPEKTIDELTTHQRTIKLHNAQSKLANNNKELYYSDDQFEESISSESYLIERVDGTETLFDLISFLKIYLKKIENNFCLDELYSFLKTSVQSSYRNFTVESLEKYTKNKYTSSLGVYNDASPATSQKNYHKVPPKRSFSQLKHSKASHDQQTQKSSNKPVQKLLENLKLFKTVFHLIQRDLIMNIFLFKIPNSEKNNIFLAQRPKSRSMNDINSFFKANDQQNRQKMIEKVKNYHEILYELNEKIQTLINERKKCDMKLLSPHSALQAKYLYFKNGEYVLRLTTDIISKFQMILNICQTVTYLHFKLKENDFHGSNAYGCSKIEDYSEDCEYDREFNFYSCPQNEVRKQYAVLKLIPRKKAQAFQKLPKILNTDSSLAIKNLYIPNKAIIKNNDQDSSYHQFPNTKPKNMNKLSNIRTQESLINERNMLVEALKLRLDSNDSFIRETDSDSIASDDDSVFGLNLNEDSDFFPGSIEVYFTEKNKD